MRGSDIQQQKLFTYLSPESRAIQKGKGVEETFGWLKAVAWLRKARYKGEGQIDWQFTRSTAADDMVRMGSLETAASG